MVEPDHGSVSVRRQCCLLGLSRSGWYGARDRKPSEEDVELMNEIDRLYTKWPWYGSRRIREALWREKGQRVNRKHIQRLMRRMRIAGAMPRRKTSQRCPKHPVYPYLLRGVQIARPDQVWSTDITYVPVGSSFMYLVAVLDWYSRYVLSWELSNTLDSSFCVDVLQTSLLRGKPEIFNTDQGSQFTADAFTSVLRAAEIRISMDGRGRALDNVFVERLWRSVKYEDIYLHAYESVPELYRGLIRYFRYYNEERPHQGLDYRTPGEVYRGEPEWNPEGGRRPWDLLEGGAPAGEGPGGPPEAGTQSTLTFGVGGP